MERTWTSRSDLTTTKETAGHSLSVMQWNILAQTLAKHGEFQFATEEMLAWENRRQLIIKELLQHRPDVICLEEVDCFHWIRDQLQSVGYQGCFVPKPKSPCLKFEDNIGPDGNAVFTKQFGSPCNIYHKVLCLEDGTETNSTVMIYETKGKFAGQVVFILSTHLKASSAGLDVRRQQAQHLVRIIEELRSSNANSSVILCGDLNADPDEPAIQILKNSGLKSAYEASGGSDAGRYQGFDI